MRRRRRRVVAPPTRLGPSEEGDLTALAPPRRATDRGTEPSATPPPGETGSETTAARGPAQPTLPDRAQEDTDEAWGDTPDSDSRVLREKPPHWQ